MRKKNILWIWKCVAQLLFIAVTAADAPYAAYIGAVYIGRYLKHAAQLYHRKKYLKLLPTHTHTHIPSKCTCTNRQKTVRWCCCYYKYVRHSTKYNNNSSKKNIRQGEDNALRKKFNNN